MVEARRFSRSFASDYSLNRPLYIFQASAACWFTHKSGFPPHRGCNLKAGRNKSVVPDRIILPPRYLKVEVPSCNNNNLGINDILAALLGLSDIVGCVYLLQSDGLNSSYIISN